MEKDFNPKNMTRATAADIFRIYKNIWGNYSSKEERNRQVVSAYEKMYTFSGGKCFICGESKKLLIDHNHSNGKVRGLLCRNCKTGLGLFKDSTDFLKKAIGYLVKNS